MFDRKLFQKKFDQKWCDGVIKRRNGLCSRELM